ncbi:MAG: transketolase [Sediminibacterium sp.]|jgi:pyruvate/2-oxoglutarate/acetoin dehydrogenase E1 component/TPP-dependent pyruvate/acetoin dehydrogenase alpha subunit|nr:transketolase [Sediminibacterium sp.]
MESHLEAQNNADMLSFEAFRSSVIADYRLALLSREVSLLGRREVLTGKAKFGIFGDGKEVAQVALAKYFQKGDFRSGYYRDQTMMFALGVATVETYFAQLYADTIHDPFCGGKNMNSHFSTRFVLENGEWNNLTEQYNISCDIAPTAGQMARGLGLAFASKCFRNIEALSSFTTLSNQGNEVCFCTIGDASTSEGQFWEVVNAAGVLQVPLVIFVYDDGYGISVPTKFQTTKGSISEVLKGFEKESDTNGIQLYKVKGWDYASMCETFELGIDYARTTHTPVVFHVQELTQPQGHSTSGSHERYKSSERLAWEREWDCNKKMKEWLILNELTTEEALNQLEIEVKQEVRDAKQLAWDKYVQPIKQKIDEAIQLIQTNISESEWAMVEAICTDLINNKEPLKRDIFRTVHVVLETIPQHANAAAIQTFLTNYHAEEAPYYAKDLYNEGPKSTLNVSVESVQYASDAPVVNGYEVLNQYFDELFATNPKVFAFGEDVGNIGDVNQGFAGLQLKHGEDRIFDTGIREQTIMGQAHGLAMRGLRPIAEIQYLDYLIYGLQTLSDDIATLHYRSNGSQSSPVIIRTRGHRLEGIFHSGSPMGMIINSLRGMHVCVPRNMVQAVGMYNTLLRGNDPALLIECLNGYRLKEKMPSNITEYTIPLGKPEILKEGGDITLVSYGSTLRIIQDAAERLETMGIDCEIIDVQTLLPFDINHIILSSLKKTSRILFIDEDVPGGASAYMLQQVIEIQGGYRYLDVAARTLSAKAHRPAYASDGDYFSKPNTEEVIKVVNEMMAE